MAGQIFKTITHKMTAFYQMKLYIYLPPRTQTLSPILPCVYGGGLHQGNRAGVPPHMIRGISKYNYALVSTDYRLAPHMSVPEILSDVLDCLAFIRNDLAGNISPILNTSKIAPVGPSAGGYLTLLAGLYAELKPDVVMVIYPLTNSFGEFFIMPRTHRTGRVEREVVAPFLHRSGEVERSLDAGSERNKMYYWMLQEVALAELYSTQKGDQTCIVAAAVRS